ncbi:hypothetical protein ACHAQA_009376 [Verticillium albo-atrum]
MTVGCGGKSHRFEKTSGLVLDVGIVGAGIAGLTAAASLIRLGHKVTIYEQSRFASELGAAVNIGPNAAPVLDAIGFDEKRARLMEMIEGKQFDGTTMKENYRGRYDNFASKFHAPWYSAHRVDLHSELKRLALEPLEDAAPAILHLASPVVWVDCEAALLKLQDGTEVRKDLIVGADGLHSLVARCVLGADVASVVVKECVYRFLIPTSKLLDSPITKTLFQEDVATIHVAAASHRRLVWYPCRGGDVQNFVALHPSNLGHKGEPAVKEDQAQAANQAIEDAGALGIFLENVKSYDKIPQRLELVQNTRRDRASAM